MNVRTTLATLAAGLCLAFAGAAALADKVILKDGTTLEGRVTEADGFVYVKTAKPAPVRIDRNQVQEIIAGPAETPATASAGQSAENAAETAPSADSSARTTGLSNVQALAADTPEPIVYWHMRRLLSASAGADKGPLRKLIEAAQAAYHDGAIRSGDQWLDAKELQRRREAFEKDWKEANGLLTKSQQSSTAKDPATVTKLVAEASVKLRLAAKAWPDPQIRRFLLAQLALNQKDRTAAIDLFSECIRRQPLVAAYYQGRAMAYTQADQPMRALDDAVQVMRLRDDQLASYLFLEEALKNVPGTSIKEKQYVQALALFEQYEPPKNRSGSAYQTQKKGLSWLMPGGTWQAMDNGLTLPAFDYYVARKAVAVPVSQNGILLVDSAAIEGASEMLLELAPNQYRRAEVVKLGWTAGKNAPPLAAIRVEGFSFTPIAAIESDKVASLKGQSLKVLALSLPEELDSTRPRRADVTVTQVGSDGALTLPSVLRPGEGAAPVLTADNRLVTFITGRTDPTADGGGAETVLPPTDVAKLAAQAEKTGASRSAVRRSNNAPTLRAATQPATGQVFTLHILTGIPVQTGKR